MCLYIGLVHYPVYNKNNERIASAISTLGLHDIARVARTYDVRKFFVITPLADQQVLAERIRRHWTNGFGAGYNSDRKKAFELVAIVPSLEQAIHTTTGIEGKAPLLIATDASRQKDRSISYQRAREIIQDGRVIILLFGTAWGLDKCIIDRADYVLDPISGKTNYNHLSVRAAAAIILDRLAGGEPAR